MYYFQPLLFQLPPSTPQVSLAADGCLLLPNTKFLVFFFFVVGQCSRDLPDCSYFLYFLVVSMMVKATNFVSVDNVFPSVLLVCAAKISSLTKKVLPDHFYLFIAKIFQKRPNRCVIYFQITFFRLFCKHFANQNRK